MSRRCDLSADVVLSKGNKVSKSNRKSKRWFIPNLQSSVFSSKLGSFSLTVATRTVRTITKYGGFDSYILGVKKKRLTSFGQSLRKKLLAVSSGDSSPSSAS